MTSSKLLMVIVVALGCSGPEPVVTGVLDLESLVLEAGLPLAGGSFTGGSTGSSRWNGFVVSSQRLHVEMQRADRAPAQLVSSLQSVVSAALAARGMAARDVSRPSAWHVALGYQHRERNAYGMLDVILIEQSESRYQLVLVHHEFTRAAN